MNPDELQLAIAYAELKGNIAFLDFMEMQRAQCEALEAAALAMPASAGNLEVRTALVAWQQRRIVIRDLEELVNSAAIRNEEIDGQPARTDRSGW